MFPWTYSHQVEMYEETPGDDVLKNFLFVLNKIKIELHQIKINPVRKPSKRLQPTTMASLPFSGTPAGPRPRYCYHTKYSSVGKEPTPSSNSAIETPPRSDEAIAVQHTEPKQLTVSRGTRETRACAFCDERPRSRSEIARHEQMPP